jgi:hypothetical protein
MPEMRPHIYVVSVQTDGSPKEYYAAYAESSYAALLIVSNGLQTKHERLEFHKVLQEDLAKQLDLKLGEFKKYE